MELFPALDLLDGTCVRLRQGDFSKKTVYSNHPWVVLEEFKKAGVKNLHLVDLSGAKSPQARQISLIRELVADFDLKIQCGGGLRTFSSVRDLLETGVERAVLGSMAVTDPALTLSILKEFGGKRITLALDVMIDAAGEAKILTHGWTQTSDQSIFVWIDRYRSEGLDRILCTDVSRDGMMTGPNFKLYQDLVEKFPEIQFQASGGVASLLDLRTLKGTGVHSAIVGKALYEGKILVKEALSQC